MDFAAYGAAIAIVVAVLVQASGRGQWTKIACLVLIGLGCWTLIEYLLHRFVLHGLQPFARWHEEHHQRPTALIYTPTILSLSLIAALALAPALALSDLVHACALTLGLLIGYVAYAITHHAIHHWHTNLTWLKRRKQMHAIHHHLGQPCHYGVTSSFWDRVFRSGKA